MLRYQVLERPGEGGEHTGAQACAVNGQIPPDACTSG